MRNRTIILAGLSVFTLSACETLEPFTGSKEQTHFVSASIQQEERVEYVQVPVPVAKPYLKQLPDISDQMVKANKVSPERAIEEARKASLQISTPDGFINAMQVFDYMPGALYEIYASPGYITSIVLQPGEQLIAKTAGDTVRWIMGETTSGSGKDQRTVLIVKPIKPGLSTNMMVTTDQRIYMIEARSVSGGVYNASVSWNYPQDDFKELERQAQTRAIQEEQIIAGQVNIHDLDYNYKMDTVQGSKPDWMPVETFDDGLKTYIRFDNDLGTTKAPVLYVLSDAGSVEIVNYRVRGNFYIIDRLIKTAELRMGTKNAQIVRITKQGKRGFFDRLFGGHNDAYNG